MAPSPGRVRPGYAGLWSLPPTPSRAARARWDNATGTCGAATRCPRWPRPPWRVRGPAAPMEFSNTEHLSRPNVGAGEPASWDSNPEVAMGNPNPNRDEELSLEQQPEAFGRPPE